MSEEKQVDFEKQILHQIKSGEIRMKPKWVFALGSGFLFASLVALGMVVIFLVNLSVFILRHTGARWGWRIDTILNTFPWWIPVVGLVSLIAAIWLLKRYDFSYKNNFWVLLMVIVLALITSGVVLDQLGFNELLNRGGMRRYYQQWEGGSGWQPQGGKMRHLYKYNSK